MIIKIKNFRLTTIIGFHDWEKEIPREIIINLQIITDDEKSLISDDINDAIDYERLSSQIKHIVDNNCFQLVEALAKKIITEIMLDLRIKECQLEIDKMGAIPNIESFSVTLNKIRS
jgi:FolB domain-containing protein